MTSNEEVLAAIDPPTRPPALSIDERDAILHAATAHTAACRAHQKWTDTGVDEAGAAAVDTTLERLREMLNQATTTQVDQQLLDRTLERDRAIQERDAARKERDIGVTYNREANASGEHVAAELERFKEKVVQVASDAADEHGWCGEIDQALAELGLERKRTKYRATLTITVEFEAELAVGLRELPKRTRVRNAINQSAIEDEIKEMFDDDEDHESCYVDGIAFEVTDIRDAG